MLSPRIDYEILLNGIVATPNIRRIKHYSDGVRIAHYAYYAMYTLRAQINERIRSMYLFVSRTVVEFVRPLRCLGFNGDVLII